MSKVHNFSPGPCILPQEVLKESSDAILNFDNLGLSLIEISHRSKNFIAVMDESIALVKELLGVPEGYSVLFLQGGASLGFLMTAHNMMGEKRKAGYINTGTWATSAIKEAKFVGDVEVIASSEQDEFTYIPKGYSIPTDIDYLHITTNNTIYGTQFKEYPKTSVSMVADMSSDIFSKKIDVSQFDLIYAGAQKNMGPAGTTVYIVKDKMIGRSGMPIPSMLDFRTHISKESMYNTPPVFAVYVSMLNLRWLKKIGGVSAIEKINDAKAQLLYTEIDKNPLFKGIVTEKSDRSNMNATFTLTDESLTTKFEAALKEAKISGLNGHRSVGGYRASMYNALPLESVQALVDVMKNFN